MSRFATPFAALLLVLTALAPAGRADPVAGDPDCLRAVAGVDLQTATIAQLSAAMTAGTLTSERLTQAYIDRIEAYDRSGPKLNSVRVLHPDALTQARALDGERAAGRVRGPLHGIPVLLKDNIGTVDLPTTAGSVALEGAMTSADAVVAQRLRAAGAVILGKANLSEFAGWVSLNAAPGWSSLAGQVLNAYDALATPSGSSSGSGVAASMAFAAATIGTETSGSILSPSSANGVVGLKTSWGAVSTAGILPLSPGFDVPGPIVRSVADAAVVFDAIAEPGQRRAGVLTGAIAGRTFAYSSDDRDALGPESALLFDAAVKRLEKLGATVAATDTLGNAQLAGLVELGAIPNDFKWSLNAYLATVMRPETLKARTLAEIVAFRDGDQRAQRYDEDLLVASDATPGLEPLGLAQGAATRAAAAAVLEAALAESGADAILTPGPAHANIGAAAGWPTALVPAGATNKGRTPFTIGFLGRLGEDATLLGDAAAFERDARARVAPTLVNRKLAPRPCPAAAPPPLTTPAVLATLAVDLVARRRTLTARARPASGRVSFVLRRGTRVVARRSAAARAGVARVRFAVRRAGRYSVVALAQRPSRTARSRPIRIR